MEKDAIKLFMSIVLIAAVWWLAARVMSGDVAKRFQKDTVVSWNETENESGTEKDTGMERETDTDDENSLVGITIVVDPGHGGNDPGMVGLENTLEKDLNLQMALLLSDILREKGAEVVLTRSEDKGLYAESDKNKKICDMKKRCELITQSKADFVVSIHQNSFSEEEVSGAQVFYYTHSAGGKKLAEDIQVSLKENVDNENTRKAKPNDSYYMLVHTPCPSVIVECGFITNYEEMELLRTEKYQKKICLAIVKGIEVYVESDRGE